MKILTIIRQVVTNDFEQRYEKLLEMLFLFCLHLPFQIDWTPLDSHIYEPTHQCSTIINYDCRYVLVSTALVEL